ncbi:antitoxin Xre/MbcA/ParS toxin-binding domain-containing protein [Ectopseudomonas hydrolytica]
MLSNEAPVELLVTEFGKRAVRQSIRAIEYGLPV